MTKPVIQRRLEGDPKFLDIEPERRKEIIKLLYNYFLVRNI